jgi:hypothetical protein
MSLTGVSSLKPEKSLQTKTAANAAAYFVY